MLREAITEAMIEGADKGERIEARTQGRGGRRQGGQGRTDRQAAQGEAQRQGGHEGPGGGGRLERSAGSGVAGCGERPGLGSGRSPS